VGVAQDVVARRFLPRLGSECAMYFPVIAWDELFNFVFAFNNNRVNYNTSLVGGIPQTQQLVDFCAEHKIAPAIQIIAAKDVNQAWEEVIHKEARYRYVIDAATL
jgi:D-arabinose 1-dehydrogenase-like Zn-dependent alcohol dehydrogenase